jgi:hypothetical protein
MHGIRVSLNGIIFMLHFVKIVKLFMLHFVKIVQPFMLHFVKIVQLFMLYFVKIVQLFMLRFVKIVQLLEKLKWRNGHTDDVVISKTYFSLFRNNSV